MASSLDARAKPPCRSAALPNTVGGNDGVVASAAASNIFSSGDHIKACSVTKKTHWYPIGCCCKLQRVSECISLSLMSAALLLPCVYRPRNESLKKNQHPSHPLVFLSLVLLFCFLHVQPSQISLPSRHTNVRP